MSQNNVTVQFEIVLDGQVQGTQEFDLDAIKVGKLSSSHLRLDDPNVARIHAVIERNSEGTYTVMDLGSASGTLVNGSKITKAELNDGDELQFGGTVLRVRYVAAQVAPPVAPAGVYDYSDDFGEATVITSSLSERIAAAQSAEQSAAQGASAPAETPGNHVRLPDGSLVECYTMVGEYDDAGNYHPAYYDESGQYCAGYVFTDDNGQRQILYGYYDPHGEWISTDEDEYQGPSDTEVYTETYFSDTGGDTLEVAFLWRDHVLGVTSFPKARTVLVGANEKNDFVIEDEAIPSDAYPLVSFSGDGSYSVTLTPQMQGLVQNGNERYSIQEVISGGMARGSSEVSGAYSLPIGARTSVRIDLGDNTFLIRFSTLPAVIGGGFSIERAPIMYIGGSAVVHVLLLMMVLTWPDNARGIDLDSFGANDRFVQMMIKPDQEEEEVKPDWLGAGDEEEAAKHKGDEGQAGKEDSNQANKMLQIEGPTDNKEIELKKIRDTEIAMSAGAMAVFNDNQVGSMWGSSDQSVGSDAIHALGNLTGDSVGEARGMGGLGLHGAGRGGGGVSERGIGLANVGTAGRGGGGRGGTGYGKNEANLGDRNTLQPKIVPGKPAVTGSLDREIIQRVVRQHRREITYCYESELQKNRNLAGRVTVRFTISATGSVVSATTAETSMNNAAVERCINDRIRRWVFPEPKGGGIVIVNYPFNFSS